ncbi:HAD family hydrolase [Streptomyces sp. bgisy031]|uniref:HAD family hydrolase n=1 Tax=Streptomyces sp. bgisy031 TaxID=3413772 RepID=UPI003D70F10F
MTEPDRRIAAVVFDVGETLRDDTGEFGAWADWLGVPRHTFSAVLGAVRARGGSTNDVFQYFQPGFDLEEQRRLRAAAGIDEQMGESDLYPDVRPALTQLRRLGLWIGVTGNQSGHCADLLRKLELPVDVIHTSGEWGVEKPSPQFFDRVTTITPHPPPTILYVGDHWIHDVLAAAAAGLQTAFLRRGPWGYLHAAEPSTDRAPTFRIHSLAELPDLVRPQLS